LNDKTIISWQEIYRRAELLPPGRLYGIPRGGSIVAGLTGRAVDKLEQADAIVDDIIDSGATAAAWQKRTGKRVVALFDKTDGDADLGWVVFPWEGGEHAPQDAVTRLLSFIGEDPTRDGLLDTPARVTRMLAEMTTGYQQEPADILKRVFDDGCDEMVILKGIRFTSLCEHHMLPFQGTASVGYLPRGRVVGISKLARLVQCFARRLQIQERMTRQIAEALEKHLDPMGVGVVVEAHHECMGCRGVLQPTASMVTSSMLGEFRTNPPMRAEFLRLTEWY